MSSLNVPLLNPVATATADKRINDSSDNNDNGSNDTVITTAMSGRHGHERVDPAAIRALPLLEKTHLFLHGYLGYWSVLFMHTLIVIILVNTTAFILR
jgi:hypothetical protein